jgi:hypothetical protein
MSREEAKKGSMPPFAGTDAGASDIEYSKRIMKKLY